MNYCNPSTFFQVFNILIVFTLNSPVRGKEGNKAKGGGKRGLNENGRGD